MEPLPGEVVPRAPSPNPFPEKYRRPCLALYKTCAQCIYCEGCRGLLHRAQFSRKMKGNFVVANGR